MTEGSEPGLIGLVLAGGSSSRMGEDKGGLAPFGVPQAERCLDLLAPHCRAVYCSVREAQAELAVYRERPLILDDGPVRGPAAGLLAAWSRHPEAALLVLAVDLMLVDAPIVERLVRQRAAAKLATAYRNADGVLEPLCTIWESAARTPIEQAAAGGRSPSLRRALEQSDVETLECPDPERLVSCNTPDGLAAVLDALATHRAR